MSKPNKTSFKSLFQDIRNSFFPTNQTDFSSQLNNEASSSESNASFEVLEDAPAQRVPKGSLTDHDYSFIEKPGPLEGHNLRRKGSPRKTRMRPKIECSLEEIEFQWRTFKENIVLIHSEADGYRGRPIDVIRNKLQPHLDQIYQILIEEDQEQIRKFGIGSFGECMEFAFDENIIIQCIAIAQADYPRGIFNLCIQFVIDLCLRFRGMPIIHKENVHRELLRLTKQILSLIQNEFYQVNDQDSSETISTMLRYVGMITEMGTNRDPEICKFFIEEASATGKNRGTQTFIPLLVLLDILKKETPQQNPRIRQELRQEILGQLKIQNDKVRRFILLESEFALNILNKLLYYLDLLPQEIQLIRNVYTDFPDKTDIPFKGMLNLRVLLENTHTKNLGRTFDDFLNFSRFFNAICCVSASSQVFYKSSYNGRENKLVLLDQLDHFFFANILIDYFQPLILQENKRNQPSQGGGQDFSYLATVRTALQKFSVLLEVIEEPQIIKTMFYFIFGRPQKRAKAPKEDDDLFAKAQYDELDDEPLDLLGNQDVSPKQDKMTEMNLHFSVMNLKNKNQANAMSLKAFSNDSEKHKALSNMQAKKNDDIMKIFDNLPLDKEDQDFLDNPSAPRLYQINHEDLEDHIGFLSDYDQILKQKEEAAGNKSHLDNYANQTMMTNFDGELEELEDESSHRQDLLMVDFLYYIMLDTEKPNKETKFSIKMQAANESRPSFLERQGDIDKSKAAKDQKLNVVCLRIIDLLLSKNLCEVNSRLLLEPLTNSLKAKGTSVIETQGSKFPRVDLKEIQNHRYWRLAQKSTHRLSTEFKWSQGVLSNAFEGSENPMLRKERFVQTYLDLARFRNPQIKTNKEIIHSVFVTLPEIVIDSCLQNKHNNYKFLTPFDGKVLRNADTITAEFEDLDASASTMDERKRQNIKNWNLVHVEEFDMEHFKETKLRERTHQPSVDDRYQNSFLSQNINAAFDQVPLTFSLQTMKEDLKKMDLNQQHRYSDSFIGGEDEEDDCDIDSIDSREEKDSLCSNLIVQESIEKKASPLKVGRLSILQQEESVISRQTDASNKPFLQPINSSRTRSNIQMTQPDIEKKGRNSAKVENSMVSKLHTYNSQAARIPKVSPKGGSAGGVFNYNSSKVEAPSLTPSLLFKVVTEKLQTFSTENSAEENILVLSLVDRILNLDLNVPEHSVDADQQFAMESSKIENCQKMFDIRYRLLHSLMEAAKQCDVLIDNHSNNGGSSSPLKSGRAHTAQNFRNQQVGQCFQLCLQCLVIQIIRNKRVKKGFTSFDALDKEILYGLIPPVDRSSGQLQEMHALEQQCRELFHQKQRLIQAVALMTVYSQLELPAMLQAQVVSAKAQQAYEAVSNLDRELEGALNFYSLVG